MLHNSAQQLSDEQLIRSLALGDSSVINSIYKSCYPTIEKMVFKMNGYLHYNVVDLSLYSWPHLVPLQERGCQRSLSQRH